MHGLRKNEHNRTPIAACVHAYDHDRKLSDVHAEASIKER